MQIFNFTFVHPKFCGKNVKQFYYKENQRKKQINRKSINLIEQLKILRVLC